MPRSFVVWLFTHTALGVAIRVIEYQMGRLPLPAGITVARAVVTGLGIAVLLHTMSVWARSALTGDTSGFRAWEVGLRAVVWLLAAAHVGAVVAGGTTDTSWAVAALALTAGPVVRTALGSFGTDLIEKLLQHATYQHLDTPRPVRRTR